MLNLFREKTELKKRSSDLYHVAAKMINPADSGLHVSKMTTF